MDNRQEALAERYYTVKEVAELLDISVGTVYHATQRGELGYMKYGSRKGVRIPQRELDDWVRRSTYPPELGEEAGADDERDKLGDH